MLCEFNTCFYCYDLVVLIFISSVNLSKIVLDEMSMCEYVFSFLKKESYFNAELNRLSLWKKKLIEIYETQTFT